MTTDHPKFGPDPFIFIFVFSGTLITFLFLGIHWEITFFAVSTVLAYCFQRVRSDKFEIIKASQNLHAEYLSFLNELDNVE